MRLAGFTRKQVTDTRINPPLHHLGPAYPTFSSTRLKIWACVRAPKFRSSVVAEVVSPPKRAGCLQGCLTSFSAKVPLCIHAAVSAPPKRCTLFASLSPILILAPFREKIHPPEAFPQPLFTSFPPLTRQNRWGKEANGPRKTVGVLRRFLSLIEPVAPGSNAEE